MMDYRHIEVAPLSGALGAELFGVDLSKPISDEVFSEIHRAFVEHLVIFFRDQDLTPEQHKAFGRRFGPLDTHTNYRDGLEGHPEILPVVTEKEDREVFAEGWHADVTYRERPALGAILYAKEVPPYGGDTQFSNMYLAYESLSAGMKALLDALVAVHAYRNSETATAEHPVVRTHPESGRRALFVNSHYTRRFKGMTEAESAPLLSFLYGYVTRPEFTCRFRWRTGSIAFWDNRCAMHCPVPDYIGQRRVLHRLSIEGDRPV